MTRVTGMTCMGRMTGITCEQVLWRRDEEGELATTSLEFEYLRQKSRCEMLIGGDDICYDFITLGTCLSMFVYI